MAFMAQYHVWIALIKKLYMRTLLLSMVLNALFANIFAQCNSTEEVNNMPTIYSKGYSESYTPTPEQEKLLTGIFTSVIEPALKCTKGLKGNWKPMGVLKGTSFLSQDGLAKSEIEMYMDLMGCRNHKIYIKDEAGLILVFTLNGFIGGIDACPDERDTIIKSKTEKLYLNDMLNGRNIYHLHKQTPSDKYANLAFYTMTDNAKYFVIAKPGVPLFIPVTVRQALEISRKKLVKRIEFGKQELSLPFLKAETHADYEKRMAKDFAAYRSTFPDPEKFISDLIKQLEEQKIVAIKGQQLLIDDEVKALDVLSDYIEALPPEGSGSPAYNSSLLSMAFPDKSEFISFISTVNTPEAGALVILNPAYFNRTLSKTAPQFISVEMRIQDDSPVTFKAFNAFEANLDFDKLQKLLVK